MTTKKPKIEEIIKNNLDTSITILTNFDFGKSPLTASIVEAATMCKIYDPNEYEKFKAKGILFNSLSEEIEKEVDKYIKCLETAKQKGNTTQDLAKQLSELKYSYNVSKLMQISKDKPPSPEKNELLLTLINETLERNESGKILSNVKNYELILQFDPVVSNCVGYDAFAYRITPLRTDLPWRQSSIVNFNEWSELDDAALQNYLNRTYGNLNNEKIFRNVLQEVANKNSFHPVRNYLESLPPWDGIERASRLFIELLGAKDCEYTKSITIHWLKAAIARIYYPGCKFDYCLVLKGAQGKGKSTILAKLGEKWFNDSIFDISGKEALENLQGNWIIEIGEMQATKRADNEAIKAFFSRTVDKFRLPYGRRTIEFPRQCVFAGTTNLPEFLKDRTGGRRFWIIVCDDTFDNFKVLNDIDKNCINQIWAEVLYKFKEEQLFNERNLLPSKEILEQAKLIQEAYTEGSALDGLITAFLEMPIPDKTTWDNMSKPERRKYANNDGRGFEIIEGYGIFRDAAKTIPTGSCRRDIVCAAEIAYECLNIDNPNKDRISLKDINEILDSLPNWELIGRKSCGIYGIQRRVYRRKIIRH